MRETLSDIYYRIHYYDETVSGVHQLQAKLQCRWMQNATRAHFGVVGWGGKTTLSQPINPPHRVGVLVPQLGVA
jgi:hypothetical protein